MRTGSKPFSLQILIKAVRRPNKHVGVPAPSFQHSRLSFVSFFFSLLSLSVFPSLFLSLSLAKGIKTRELKMRTTHQKEGGGY